MTTVDNIKEWFENGKKKKATHMIIVCDTFSHEDYPVYVGKGESASEKYSEYSGKSIQRVMEVYNLSKSMERQLKTVGRNFNY